MRRRSLERGGAVLEFALTTPLLLALMLGGFHFTRALVTRVRMGDIAAYAARAAVTAQKSDSGSVQQYVTQRTQGNPPGNCQGGIGVTTRIDTLYSAPAGSPPNAGKALTVELRCTTESKNIFGKWLIPASNMVVSASYPF